MLIPTYISLRYWFYPIRNTPAVDLLRYSPQGAETRTKILCLASGDTGNILFTLWTENANKARSFEITTCDSEPAVLARNLLLLTFLVSNSESPHPGVQSNALLYALTYHLVITSSCLEALQVHLIELLSASPSVKDWKTSRFGSIFRFTSHTTLAEIRRFWQLYLDACQKNNNQGSGIRLREIARATLRRQRVAQDHLCFNDMRCLGIHALSPTATEAMSNAFHAYWQTGVTAGNHPDVLALERENGGFANPLFAVSSAPSDAFALHYGSDPLLGFHLAAVFDEVRNETAISDVLAGVAKSQFSSWCKSFVEHAGLGSVVLVFHCGEAITYCHELQRRADKSCAVSTSLCNYTRPWSSVPLDLGLVGDLRNYGTFDVIDTSNISDRVGILNLMPAIVPLLNSHVSSTLYTEIGLGPSRDVKDHLKEVLRTNVELMWLTSGIAPTAYLLGHSTENFGYEATIAYFSLNSRSKTQMRVRMAWQKPHGGDLRSLQNMYSLSPSVSANADDLAGIFLDWYLNISSEAEDTSEQLAVNLRRVHDPWSCDLVYNTRFTLVSLIALAQGNIRTDWTKCVETLLKHIASNETQLVSSNSLQELHMFLYMFNIYQSPALKMSPDEAAHAYATSTGCSVSTNLKRFPTMPKIITVALIVPRANLRIFESLDLDRIGTPGLHLVIHNPTNFENSFFAIHTCFGELDVDPDKFEATIAEDPLGWTGTSSLIVICPVPGFQFLVGREADIRVALVVNSSTANTYFVPLLGPALRIFDTSVANHRNLQLLRAAPGRPRNETPKGSKMHIHRQDTQPVLSVSFRGKRLDRLMIREHFAGRPVDRVLESTARIEVSQRSPCTMDVTIGAHVRTLVYPHPVDGSQSHTKVSRKQSWIEVAVPTSCASQQNGYKLRPFPVVSVESTLNAWGMSRINLSRQPIIPAFALLEHVKAFLGMTFSDSEKIPPKDLPWTASLSGLIELKESIATIILALRGQHESPSAQTAPKWNCFRVGRNDKNDLLLLANSLRHDLDSGSICLDAYVIALNDQRIPQLSNALGRLMSGQRILSIPVSHQESIIWRNILPALTERCRFDWEHKRTCEYRVPDMVCPRSMTLGQMPICTCGEGQEAQDLLPEFEGFERFATRIAIPVLSAIPYVNGLAFEAFLRSFDPRESSSLWSASTNPSGTELVAVCDHCQATKSNLKSCSGCGNVLYCDKTCQRLAWETHKPRCQKET